MSSEGLDPPTSPEGTRVDLGDDLLADPTRAIHRTPPQGEKPAETLLDRWASARILFNEGFIEECKEALHQILIEDPSHLPARKKLEEIHEKELQDILSDAPARPTLQRRSGAKVEEMATWQIDEIVDRLDTDLGLGLGSFADLSLFADTEFDRIPSDLGYQGHVDLGIAFLEMEAYSHATKQFEQALEQAVAHWRDDPTQLVSAAGLLAFALISSDRAFEAAAALQPILRDHEIADQAKVEIFYLMGRASERQGKPELARGWYRKVLAVDPKYRDAKERLQRPN